MPAEPNPAPAPETNPELTVVPEATPRREKSFLNQRQAQKLMECKLVCLAAQESGHAPVLTARNVPAAFVAQLLGRIEAALGCSTMAAAYTDRKEGATLSEADAEEQLIRDLRSAQAAARQTYEATNPAKLGEYFIGDRIDANRATLDNAAQGIVARMNEQRPDGVNTDFIIGIEGKRSTLAGKDSGQGLEQEHATAERASRDSQYRTIVLDTRKIQYAVDAAWPPGGGHAAVRRRFRIPPNRPYAPPVL